MNNLLKCNQFQNITLKSMLKLFICLILLFQLSACTTKSIDPNQRAKAVGNYLSLARGYLQEGFSEKAIKPLKRALELNYNAYEVYGLLAVTYQLQGEKKLADEAFKKALDLNPDASSIRNNYGAFLFQSGELYRAYIEFARAASDVDYDSRSRAYENMGLVALQQNKKNLALTHFLKAVRLNSNLPSVQLEIAKLYKDQGKLQLAWLYYKNFTKLVNKQSEEALALGTYLAKQLGYQSVTR